MIYWQDEPREIRDTRRGRSRSTRVAVNFSRISLRESSREHKVVGNCRVQSARRSTENRSARKFPSDRCARNRVSARFSSRVLPGRAIHFLFRLDFEERGAAARVLHFSRGICAPASTSSRFAVCTARSTSIRRNDYYFSEMI